MLPTFRKSSEPQLMDEALRGDAAKENQNPAAQVATSLVEEQSNDA